MKRLFLFLAAVVLLLAGCVKEKATLDENPQTSADEAAAETAVSSPAAQESDMDAELSVTPEDQGEQQGQQEEQGSGSTSIDDTKQEIEEVREVLDGICGAFSDIEYTE